MLVIVHFIVQVALQGVTLRDNQQAKDEITLCLSLAQVPAGVPLLDGDEFSLCDGIPGHHNVTCMLVASTDNSTLSSTLNSAGMGMFTGFDLDKPINMTVSGHEYFITGRCAVSLQYVYDA